MLSAAPGVESQKQILQTLFKSIMLSPENIKFVVRKRSLVHRLILRKDDTPGEQGSGTARDSDGDVFEIDRPMVIKRRGIEARIVIKGTSGRNPDPVLVDLIARAHSYLNRLTDGSAASINELADQISVHRADISRILPLAFLSPAITEAILAGRQPEDLTAWTLSRLIDVPAGWSEQVKNFGM